MFDPGGVECSSPTSEWLSMQSKYARVPMPGSVQSAMVCASMGKRVRDKDFSNSRGFSTFEEYKLRFRERYSYRFFQLLERHGFKNKGIRANPHSFIDLNVGCLRREHHHRNLF